MTLENIMTSTTLSDWGKSVEIESIDGRGGKYTVAKVADPKWATNGKRFRSLRTARAYATLGNRLEVIGPDATVYEPEWIGK